MPGFAPMARERELKRFRTLSGSSAGSLRGLFGGFLPRAAQPRRDCPLGVGRLRSDPAILQG